MQHCIYLRKSRTDLDAESRGEEETLLRHEKALLELANRQKLSVGEIHREVVSGETIAARPVMQQLLLEVEQGLWDGVIVMEVERLSRGDTIDQGIVAQTFKYSGTKIVTPTKTYDPANEYDEEYFEFGLFVSRREYKSINRRMQRGREASVMEGKFIGNKTPYGYQRVKLQGQKGFSLEIVPEEADIVKLIYHLFSIGETQPDGTHKRLGMSLIANRLNTLKIQPKGGAPEWSVSTIRDMLRNPVYNGKIRYNWRPAKKRMVNGEKIISRRRTSPDEWTVVPGLHDAIIDDATWTEVQKYAYGKCTRDLSDTTIKNPLAGLVYCAKCGAAMARRPHNRDYEDTLLCRRRNCDNISSALGYVEERILTSLAEWLKEYRLQWEKGLPNQNVQDASVAFRKKALKRVDADTEKTQQQLANIYDLLEQGVYTTAVFLERSQALGAKISELKRERTQLVEEQKKALLRDDSIKIIIPKIEHVLEVYHSLPDAAAKNAALKEVLKRVTYIKTVNGRWHNKPDDFEITLYPIVTL